MWTILPIGQSPFKKQQQKSTQLYYQYNNGNNKPASKQVCVCVCKVGGGGGEKEREERDVTSKPLQNSSRLASMIICHITGPFSSPDYPSNNRDRFRPVVSEPTSTRLSSLEPISIRLGGPCQVSQITESPAGR